MNKYFMLHRDVLQEYSRGVFEFARMDIEKKSTFVNNYLGNVRCGIEGSFGTDIYLNNSDYDKVVLSNKDNKISLSREFENDDNVEVLLSRYAQNSFDEEILYVLVGNEAHIRIQGVLSRGREIDSTYVKWGYSSTYNEIMLATELANKDPRVEIIVYDMNTPGGSVDGVEDAAKVIRDSAKETRTDIWFWMMSAGLFLGSQTDTIRAMSDGVQAGSLGVAYEYYDWSKWEKDVGVERHTITSKNAPDKRPNGERLDELLQEDADKLESVFVEYVSIGRNQEPEYVKNNYGRGWDLIASEALSVGMIDQVVKKSKSFDENKIQSTESFKMDSAKLKKENPEVYKEIFELGFSAGKDGVSKNVSNHLKWIGKASTESIVKNITDGKECDVDCCHQYSEENELRVAKAARGDEVEVVEDAGSEEPTEEGFQKAAGIKTEQQKIEASANKLGISTLLGDSQNKVTVFHR